MRVYLEMMATNGSALVLLLLLPPSPLPSLRCRDWASESESLLVPPVFLHHVRMGNGEEEEEEDTWLRGFRDIQVNSLLALLFSVW